MSNSKLNHTCVEGVLEVPVVPGVYGVPKEGVIWTGEPVGKSVNSILTIHIKYDINTSLFIDYYLYKIPLFNATIANIFRTLCTNF